MRTHAEVIHEKEDDLVHDWFGLSYANYLVWPRALMQSMSEEWQRQFVKLAEEIGDAYPMHLAVGRWVTCRDDAGRFIADPTPHYNRGRTLVERES